MSVAVAVEVGLCDCSACEQGLEPFTVEHFRAWAADLTLDSGGPWLLEDFQAGFLEDVFEKHGRPGVLWLVIPEGNGKTTLVGGLALYYLEHFPNPAIPVAAASKEQADTLYGQAEGFVVESERLTELKLDVMGAAKGRFGLDDDRRHAKDLKRLVPRFQCQEGFRRIKFFKGGRIQIRAADDRTGDGIIPRGIMIIDELHRHRNLSLYRTWLGKAEKASALLIVISTAGEPGGEFELEREDIRHSAEVVERTETFGRYVSEERVLHDWALPEDGDPEDFELVARANPFSAITPTVLEGKFRRLGKAGGTLQHWRRLTCNLPTRSEMAAIQESEWFDADADGDGIPAGEPIWVGLDVAWKWDDTAAAPYWWRDPQHRRLGPLRVETPPRDGTSLDPAKVERMLVAIHEANPIHTVVMDMARAEQLAAWIESELGARVIDWPQSIPFKTRDFERFMEALRQGWLKHSGDEAMTRHALNAVARVLPRGDAVFERPAQSRSSGHQDRRVIDGLVAAAMVNDAAVDEADRSEPFVEVI